MVQALLQKFFEVEKFEEIDVAMEGDKEIDVATPFFLFAHIGAEEAEAIDAEAVCEFWADLTNDFEDILFTHVLFLP